MLTLILGIAALVAFITVVVRLTHLAMSWISNKVKEKLKKHSTQKVAVGDLEQMIASCDNQIAIDELEKLADKGVTHIMADVDTNGNVETVEAIGADAIDKDVERMINKTGQGLVVIS